MWHGVEIVKRETAGFEHPLHEAFSRGLWNCLLKWESKSTDAALFHFRTHHQEGKKYRTPEAAREAMFKIERYKSSIYNYIDGAGTDRVVKDVRAHYSETKRLDLEYAEQCKQEGKGYRHYFKKNIQGIQLGAEAALENFWSMSRRDVLLIRCLLVR